ncbi:MAG: hypothetical protein KIT83_14395 [Bryobacterales bacterium]|nr:hypothetical protein [Bryobacterales bacterium]
MMRNPDEFSLRERRQISGNWVALELYTPENLALRRIAAVGDSPSACRRQLRESGKSPADYEYIFLR